MKKKPIEFTSEQLSTIRDMMADGIERYQKLDADFAEELLDIINVIQEHEENPTYDNLEMYNKNVSNTWNEIHIEEDDDE